MNLKKENYKANLHKYLHNWLNHSIAQCQNSIDTWVTGIKKKLEIENNQTSFEMRRLANCLKSKLIDW